MMRTLKEFLQQENCDKVYFKSNIPFYNNGVDFMLYRVATIYDLAKHEQSPELVFSDGFFVIPARYDSSNKEYVELIPVEVFKIQHLNDYFFDPMVKHGENTQSTIPTAMSL